jgi:lipopolysaccharide heptosyltransferase I
VTGPQKILLIRPSALGDVARSTPVLVSLKRRYPEAEVDWLVQDSFVDAVSAHPDLHEAIPFARRRYGGALGWVRSLGWIDSLRKQHYDLVVDCQGLLRSALFTFATRAPERVGYANAREGGAFAYNRKFDVSQDIHTVERMLSLIEQAGVEPIRDARLYVPVEAAAGWQEERQRLGIAEERYVVLAPTSRWPGKAWPAERFAELAQHLLGHGMEQVVIVGAKSEREQCQPVLDLVRDRPEHLFDMVGTTDVGGLMAVIAQSAGVVANDSAALHLAVGFERPIVALFGPTEPRLVGPYGRQDCVIRPETDGRAVSHKDEVAGTELMCRITTESVIERCEALLPLGHG